VYRSTIPVLLLALLSCVEDKSSIETGSDTQSISTVDADLDGFSSDVDCDDADPEIHPEATELCDEVDNDCDLLIDEDDAADAGTWYMDSDGDGYGYESGSITQCEAPSGYVAESKSGFDCDDSDASYNPGAIEDDCTDPNDYNCDGSVAYEDADGDGWAACEECDDADESVNPDAIEICDEIDNDCDTLIDDDDDGMDTSDLTEWYRDADEDGYGDEDDSLQQCTAPSGYVEESAEGFDCDDEDEAFHPGAEESDCSDPNDYNCDGSVSYDDADGDGWAACEECDDSDAEIHPNATEICNEIDDDCDGDIDDDDSGVTGTTTWYIDYDGDGYGSDDFTEAACIATEGWVEDDTDCDDTDEDIHPAATEICNEIDDDCDGDIDDDDTDVTETETWYIDYDGDGYGSSDYTSSSCEAASGWVDDDTDCDDMDSAIHPDASETCNEIDDDCDELVDDDDSDVSGTSTWYADNDADGFGNADDTSESCEALSGTVSDATDCDDADGTVNPDADEVCNEIDDDCDGDIDDEDTDVTGTSTWYIDHDGDGFGSVDYTESACEAPSGWVDDDTDCNDIDADVNPDATEICNEVDDDCDGDIDDADADLTEPTTWYADADADGYGDPDDSSVSCEAPSGTSEDGTDCDDADADVNPGAPEICNEVDDDCDGDIDSDDSDIAGASTWYIDDDGDGYGSEDETETLCEAPDGYVSTAGDCDDADDAVSPDGTETCNEIDDDCDGDIDDDDADVTGGDTWYADSDGDGYGDPDGSTDACEVPSGYVEDDTDCDDANDTVNPGGTEVCDDGLDNDCDGSDSSCSTCGDSVLDTDEEYDPPPGPYSSAVVDSTTCRYDFSGVRQLYCNGGCSWTGSSGCEQAEADILCQLIMDNPASTATSWTATTALSEPGFPCPGYGGTIFTDRGVSVSVYYQDSSILANHGAGDVIAYPSCTDP
jgi:hypothetical protein